MLPECFVWTKYGTEAGEDIDSILRRKEEERKASGGIFLWGIGNNISSSVEMLRQEASISVIFSPMLSKPKTIDCSPNIIVQWKRAYGLDNKEWVMPNFSLVTSRYKDRHYALVCRKSEPIKIDLDPTRFSVGTLQNLKSGRKIGYSQVTSVVRRIAYADNGREYLATLQAELVYPFVLVLKNPERILLSSNT